MQAIELKNVKPGDFFKRKPDAKKVYTRGEYDRASKRFAGNDWGDISRAVYLKGSAVVFIGFTF